MKEEIYKKIKESLSKKSILKREEIDQILGSVGSPSKHHLDYTIVKASNGQIYEVSTVFLDYWSKIGQLEIDGETIREFDKALEINPETKPYETMVFRLGDKEKLHLIRLHYDSPEDAKQGHNTIVKLLWEHGPDLVKKLKLSEDEEWWRKYE
jgi:hypothetical protein